jgi:hypothetical protein
MDIQSNKQINPVVRQLASLKLLSRLLGHELHAQGVTKTVTLSREEVVEIQTTVDLFIEELTRRQGQLPSSGSLQTVSAEPLASSRN